MIGKVVYTPQARKGLKEALSLVKKEVGKEKALSIRKEILDKADNLKEYPKQGQKEEYLTHLNQSHRRIIYSHYKIIYLIEETKIIVTDIFDSRQDPQKMQG